MGTFLLTLWLAGQPGPSREAVERAYQTRHQARIFAEAAKIYDPAFAPRVKIAYASFTPQDSQAPGADLGYGLHVVKRLDLPGKVIEVNESWPEDKETGGILLPDELRVKVTEGGEILFDSLRLAWGPAGEVELLRQTLWDGNRRKQLRIPVSAPLSCVKCHRDGRETRVPAGYYDGPLTFQEGYRDYVTFLRKVNPASVEAAAAQLADPALATRVPGLGEKLADYGRTRCFNWLTEDATPYPTPYEYELNRQGYYREEGTVYVDAVEDTFEGKYRWWTPTVVIPHGQN